MTHTALSSSNLAICGYEPPKGDRMGVLEVTFTSGATHRYHGVSPEQHQALLGAGSHGKHFHQHIRGKFPSEKVSG